MKEGPSLGEKKQLDFTCPECRGPMHTHIDNGPPMYSCRIGHGYSARALLQDHAATQERHLWAASLALDEAAALADEAADALPELRERLIESGQQKQRQAAIIKGVIAQLQPFPAE
jgi:two-component system chemotaxis response regulator CheB